MTSSHLVLCRPLLFLPPMPPIIRVFSNESTLRMRWPKYWSFSFSIIPSNERLGLISFRMDCLDLLSVQGTLKSLLQHHSSKASILRNRRQIEGAWGVGAEETCPRSLQKRERQSNGSRGKPTLPCLFQRDALCLYRCPQPAPRTPASLSFCVILKGRASTPMQFSGP